MRTRRYPSIFALLLFTVFVMCSALVLYLQVQHYDKQHTMLSESEQAYITQAYLRNQLNGSDPSNPIEVISCENTTCIRLPQKEMELYLYVYDGWLYEQLLVKGASISLSDGEAIAPVETWEIEETDSLIMIHMMQAGQTHDVIVSKREVAV